MASDHVLTLESPDPVATRIFDEAGSVLYTVSTKSFHDVQRRHLTEVHGAANEVLATLEWYDDLNYYVTIGNGEKKPMDHWAKTNWVPLSHSLTVKDDDGHPYKWKLHTHHNENMELFDETEGSSEKPIAHAIQSPSKHIDSKTSKDTKPDEEGTVQMHLTAKAWEVKDIVVISFLFLDKKKRDYYNNFKNESLLDG